METKNKEFVTSMARGLAVIKAFNATTSGAKSPGLGSPHTLTLTQVAERAGVVRAVARRFLLTLTELGYVETDGKHFRLTPRVLDLSQAYLSSLPFARVIQEALEEVTEKTRESASASVLDGEDIVYVARVPTRHIISVTLSIGTRLPAYCTSMGRVLLAALGPEELDAFFSRAELRRRTPHTVCEQPQLREILARVTRNGYALADQQLEEGLRSIAVPVRSPTGRVIAAINVSAQVARTTKTQLLRDFLPVLRQAAERIARSTSL